MGRGRELHEVEKVRGGVYGLADLLRHRRFRRVLSHATTTTTAAIITSSIVNPSSVSTTRVASPCYARHFPSSLLFSSLLWLLLICHLWMWAVHLLSPVRLLGQAHPSFEALLCWARFMNLCLFCNAFILVCYWGGSKNKTLGKTRRHFL